MTDIVEHVEQKFRSGNSVPIDRAWLSADEWAQLRAEIGRLRGAISAAIGEVSQPSVALDFIAERLHDSNNFPVDSDEVRSAVGVIDSAMNTLRKVLGTANE